MHILAKPSLSASGRHLPRISREKNIVILAIETSCDETAVAVLQAQGTRLKLLSSLAASQAKLHAKTGGVVPEIAARAHIENILPLIQRCLSIVKCQLSKVDIIAVTCGPGLVPALLVGVDTAKALAYALSKPLVAVNHIEAHIYSPFLKTTYYKLPTTNSTFPAISLVVSGGHTELFLVRDWLKYKKLGSTLDDAAGECFDKTARLLHLPYPGGPALARLAQTGQPKIAFPRPMINSGDFNFSFSGLKTAVLYYLRDNSPLPPLKLRGRALWKTDVAASVQAAIVDVLVSKTIRAAKKYKARTILLGGGVAANQLLRETLNLKSKFLNLQFFAAAKNFCTDNAAMIALIGYLRAKRKKFTPLAQVKAKPNWKL